MYNYPNPFSTETTIVLNEIASSATVQLIDVTGRIVQQKIIDVIKMAPEIKFTTNQCQRNVYFVSYYRCKPPSPTKVIIK
jgi:hypothetical protein